MPAAKQAVYIEFDDAMIYELQADTSSAPTYATGIDIPNVVELTGELVGRQSLLEGDATVDAHFAKFTHLTGTLRFRSVPLDVYAIITGGTVAQSGTTPDQITEFTISENSMPKSFKIAGRAAYVEGIDGVASGMRIEIYKCKANGNVRVVSLTQEWASFDVPFLAVRARSSKKIMKKVLEETQTALT